MRRIREMGWLCFVEPVENRLENPTVEPLTEEESLLAARERRVAEARKLTLFSDVFMTTALKDPAACQHVLRILTGIKTLTVKTVRTQYRISNIPSMDKGQHGFEPPGQRLAALSSLTSGKEASVVRLARHSPGGSKLLKT